jgi:hypothetical protein
VSQLFEQDSLQRSGLMGELVDELVIYFRLINLHRNTEKIIYKTGQPFIEILALE